MFREQDQRSLSSVSYEYAMYHNSYARVIAIVKNMLYDLDLVVSNDCIIETSRRSETGASRLLIPEILASQHGIPAFVG